MEKKLNKQKITVKKVIVDPSIKFAVQLCYPPILDYLIHNIQEILTYSLLNKRDNLSDTAFSIISMRNPKILQSIVENDVLNICAEEVFSEPNPSSIMINRLSDIVSYAFLFDPEKASRSCGYLYCLLKHSEMIGVRNLFKMLFTECKELEKAQEHIKSMNFPEYISQELINIKYDDCDINDIMNPIYLKTEALFHIMEAGANNILFAETYQSNSILNCLLQYINVPDFVLSAQWGAISAITQIFSLEYRNFFISPAVKTFFSLNNKIKRYHCCALDSLTNCLKSSATFVDNKFMDFLFGIFVKFNKCTELHFSIRKFINEVLQCPDVNILVTIKLAPVLINEIKMKEYATIVASSYQILNSIYQAGLSNNNLSNVLSENGFTEFADSILLKYNEKMNESYGGYESNHIVNSS